LQQALTEYFDWYNRERPHKALQTESPGDIYFGDGENLLAA
jgi:transposase InsO family protein